MEVIPLTPIIGAEIVDVDLAQPTRALIKEIENVLFDYSVVFFRDQPMLSPEQHIGLAKLFGPIHMHPGVPLDEQHSGYLGVYTDHNTKVAVGNRWHSDVTHEKEPPYISILQNHEIPPVGGDTLFSSMYAAYQAFSPRIKLLLDGLTARHSCERPYRKIFNIKEESLEAGYPEAIHPVVLRHHGSGKPALYVNREFTEDLIGLPLEEGKALLEFLFSHAERADFHCRFKWSKNAIAIWDNRSAQHFAIWDYWPNIRRGHRVAVRGDPPEMWKSSQVKHVATEN
jgi:taurine dioxygenase